MVPESDETWFDVGEAVLSVLAQWWLGNQVVTFADGLAEKAAAANLRASLQVRVAWPLWYMGHVEEIMRRAEFVRGQGDVSSGIRAEIDAFRALALSGGSDYIAAYEAGTAALDRAEHWVLTPLKQRRCGHSPKHR